MVTSQPKRARDLIPPLYRMKDIAGRTILILDAEKSKDQYGDRYVCRIRLPGGEIAKLISRATLVMQMMDVACVGNHFPVQARFVKPGTAWIDMDEVENGEDEARPTET